MKVKMLILCFFIAFLSFAHAGEMYNCIDANGDTIITDVPQDGMKCELKKFDKGSANQQCLSPSHDGGRRISKRRSNNQSTEPLIDSQAENSPSTQPIEPKEQNPAPYHCGKLCVQNHREALKTCREYRGKDINEYRSCMNGAHEQMNSCRNQCKEEESAARSNHVEEGDIETPSSGNNKTHSQTANFQLVDKRDPAEREGYPYPKSPIRHVLYGDRSLDVDRMSILKTKLSERFGSKLKGKTIQITQFYVMEAILGPTIKSGSPGDPIPNKGPFLPTLISQITIAMDEDYFAGSFELKLSLGTKATKSSLTIATTKTVDDLIKDMERHWNSQ